MNINAAITGALTPLGLDIAERLYEGDNDEFLTFNLADSQAEDFGDDDELSLVYYVQIYYACPWDMNYSDKIKAIRKTLKGAGFTYPELTDLSDSAERIRRFCFECSIENNFDLEEDEAEEDEEEESEG